MIEKRLFDYDPSTGIQEIFHWNDDGTYTIETRQDLEPTFEANKESFNSYSGPSDKWGDIHKVASIPLIILQEWMTSGKIKDQAYIKRWLNDPSNAPFRTRPGRV